MEDVIVVDTEDALLVCPKSRAQDVKKVVEALAATGKNNYL
jgi:mannose-1-phosphate guanylyltransferase